MARLHQKKFAQGCEKLMEYYDGHEFSSAGERCASFFETFGRPTV